MEDKQMLLSLSPDFRDDAVRYETSGMDRWTYTPPSTHTPSTPMTGTALIESPSRSFSSDVLLPKDVYAFSPL
jgi:hypothetical protein